MYKLFIFTIIFLILIITMSGCITENSFIKEFNVIDGLYYDEILEFELSNFEIYFDEIEVEDQSIYKKINSPRDAALQAEKSCLIYEESIDITEQKPFIIKYDKKNTAWLIVTRTGSLYVFNEEAGELLAIVIW